MKGICGASKNSFSQTSRGLEGIIGVIPHQGLPGWTRGEVSQGAVDAGAAGGDAALLRGRRGRGGGPWADLGGRSGVGVSDIRAPVRRDGRAGRQRRKWGLQLRLR